ncbi:MAG: DUF4115 domain-containing protein [Ketobacteraceae bacterium]|nr:DUF4115 domain-containing protein [Ketobacteraceae bacterium]
MSNLPLDSQRNEQPANDAGYTALMAVKPGERLKEARNARKLDLEAAAQQMNLSVSVLRALENDNYQALPSSTFIKGYIRSYARMLKLPADDLVRAFEYQTGVHSSMDEQHPLPEKQSRKGFPWIRIILVLGLLAGVIWLFLSGDDDSPAPTSQEPAAQSAAPVADTTRPPDDEAVSGETSRQLIEPPPIERETAPPAREDTPEPAMPEARAIEPVTEALTSSDMPETPAAASGEQVALREQAESTGSTQQENSAVDSGVAGVLRMEFEDDCWVEIRNKDDELIHAALYRQGSVYQRTLTEPFRVKLGNGNAVTLSYNGDPVAFTPSRSSGVARLSFGQ